MMDRDTFEGLVKDAVANLYNQTALETHPLLQQVFKPPAGLAAGKGEYIRRTVVEAIQQLRPDRKDENPSAPEWRPYFILSRRYIEGMSLPDLAASLSVSDRQMRRDHHRALQALTGILWQQLFPAVPDGSEESSGEDSQVFAVQNEPVDLVETVLGVERMLRQRLAEAGASLQIETLAGAPVTASTDRVVLRQILISLFNGVLHAGSRSPVPVRIQVDGPEAQVEVDIPLPPGWEPAAEGEEEDLPGTARYWAGRIRARLEENLITSGSRRLLRRTIWLPRPQQKFVLVVDDQGAAINMFRRFLAQTDLNVIGTNRAEQALQMARQHQPVLIILDVMMPQMDGWEVLQTLKVNEETSAIPVLICSAWEEPELSRSLGAAGFLKKPVTLKSLQTALKELRLV